VRYANGMRWALGFDGGNCAQSTDSDRPVRSAEFAARRALTHLDNFVRPVGVE
jgi:hypothetical protein